MYIDLVNLEGFRYTVNKSVYAYVKDQKLYMTKNVPFKQVMIASAYHAFGNYCYYCGRKFSKKVVKTIDHRYPEIFGGITILPNLVPSCEECNQQKSNLTESEYIQWKTIDGTEEKERFRLQCIGNHEKERLKRGTILPKDWFESKKTRILADIDLNAKIQSKKRDEAKRFFWKYGCIESPVVTSRNSYLLDGFISLWVCKEEGITKIPIVKLDNVIIITK